MLFKFTYDYNVYTNGCFILTGGLVALLWSGMSLFLWLIRSGDGCMTLIVGTILCIVAGESWCMSWLKYKYR